MQDTNDIYELSLELDRLKAWKRRPGTKIYYVEKRLKQLMAEKAVRIERKTLPGKRPARKTADSRPGVGVTRNRAYVLSCESHDLVRAIEVLEELRKDQHASGN